MASVELATRLGRIALSSPLIAASGTVGSVVEWAKVADTSYFGAAVAKSVSAHPWSGNPRPRMAPTDAGMLNSIGIQNPGIEKWVRITAPRIRDLSVPVWGSAVGGTAAEFAKVAERLSTAGVSAIEVNLSCPNLDDGVMFSFDAARSRAVIADCVAMTEIPIGAKLSPNTPDVVGVATACMEAGATFLTLTNTAHGFGINTETRRPLLSRGVGGYSGPGLKPIALRCVFEVSRQLPQAPIVGCGGVATGEDVLEYLMAGASAVGIGTTLLARPKAGRRILAELKAALRHIGASSLDEVIGSVRPW